MQPHSTSADGRHTSGASAPEKLSAEEIGRRKKEYREYADRFEERFSGFDALGAPDFERLVEPEEVEAIPFLARLKQKIAATVVLDACTVQTLLRKEVSRGSSDVLEAIRAGLLDCWVPPQLEADLSGKFEEIAEERKVTLDDVERAWRGSFAKKLKVASGHESPEVLDAIQRILRRDPTDAPYSALTITLGAAAVVTHDDDLIEDGGVQTWEIGDAVRVVRIHSRGRIATHIQFHSLVSAALFLEATAFAIKTLLKGAAALVRRMPAWAWGALIGFVGVLFCFPTTRNWILRKLRVLKGRMQGYWETWRPVALVLWDTWQPIVLDVLRASREADELNEQAGRKARKWGKLPEDLRDQAIAALRESKEALGPKSVVQKMFPKLHVCDITFLCRQISRMLRQHPEVVRVGRGKYQFRKSSGWSKAAK